MTDRKWYQEPIVWMLISVPGTAVFLGIILLVLSIRTDDGLVEDDYYKKGLAINQSLARDRQAEILGLSAEMNINAQNGEINITLKNIPALLSADVMHLSLNHATRDRLDQMILLRRTSGQQYKGDLQSKLAHGRWYIQLEAAQWRLRGVSTVTQKKSLKTLRLSPFAN